MPDATHDAQQLLARLRAGAATPPTAAPRGAREVCPATPEEAVHRWLAATGMRPGTYLSPPATHLALLVEAWAAARGWVCPVTRDYVGRALKVAGYRKLLRGGARGYGVRREDVAALRKALAALPPGEVPTVRVDKRPQRNKGERRRPPAYVPPPLLPLRTGARPLLDSRGRAWPSAAVAARALHLEASSIQHAALGTRASSAGLGWRHLTAEEVQRLPPTALAGDTVPLCFPSPCPGCTATRA
jgi:hypothetical protein